MGQVRTTVLPSRSKFKFLERHHMKTRKRGVSSFHKCFRFRTEDQEKLTRVVKHLNKKYGILTEAGAFRFLMQDFLEKIKESK